MTPVFPGIKILTLGPVMKGLKGGTSGVVGLITKAKLTIPLNRITGPAPTLAMKTASGNDWETVSNDVEHTFVNNGEELYVQLRGSGCTISAVNSTNGAVVPAIIVKVLEVV